MASSSSVLASSLLCMLRPHPHVVYIVLLNQGLIVYQYSYPLVAFGLLGWPYIAYKLFDGHV